MTETLKQAIAASGETYTDLERATGVKRGSIMRFMRGTQSIRLENADKLAVHFGIEVRPRKRKKQGGV